MFKKTGKSRNFVDFRRKLPIKQKAVRFAVGAADWRPWNGKTGRAIITLDEWRVCKSGMGKVGGCRSNTPVARSFCSVIVATAAAKLEGTSRAVDADPIPFPAPSLPRLPLLLHPCFTHSLPYSSFLLR